LAQVGRRKSERIYGESTDSLRLPDSHEHLWKIEIMNTHADKAQESEKKPSFDGAVHNEPRRTAAPPLQFVDNRPEASAQRALQEMANHSPQAMRGNFFQEIANNHSGAIVQRQIDLQPYGEKITDVPLDKVLDFLGMSDSNNKTSFRRTIEGDYGFRTALQRLIGDGEIRTYGFLQAAELMAAGRTEARITHRGATYDLDRTFRGADQARDSVYKVRGGEGISVIKSGPDLAKEAGITEQVTGHENVVGLLDREDDNSQIRLEYAAQGTLADFNVDDANKARTLIRGIINGLNHVHEQGVVHGDVGAANVFVGGTQAAPVAKIADFGESMQGPDAITNNLANDISGGTNLLQSLAAKVDSDLARQFIVTIAALRHSALDLMRKAELAVPLSAEQLELFAVLGEEPPAQGLPPTAEEITDIRARWLELLNSPFLAN
jgi:serine/threonine protein kinase